MDRDQQEVLKIAESEAMTWEAAQVNDIRLEHQHIIPSAVRSDYAGYRCFIDGSWKATNICLGIYWYFFHDDVERSMMGDRNLWKKSLSSIVGTRSTHLGHALYDCTTENNGSIRNRLLWDGKNGVYMGGLACILNIFGGFVRSNKLFIFFYLV